MKEPVTHATVSPPGSARQAVYLSELGRHDSRLDIPPGGRVVLTGLPYTVTDVGTAAGKVPACFKVPALGLSTQLSDELELL